eukprot:754952-Hanusia_phi.AAC.8
MFLDNLFKPFSVSSFNSSTTVLKIELFFPSDNFAGVVERQRMVNKEEGKEGSKEEEEQEEEFVHRMHGIAIARKSCRLAANIVLWQAEPLIPAHSPGHIQVPSRGPAAAMTPTRRGAPASHTVPNRVH